MKIKATDQKVSCQCHNPEVSDSRAPNHCVLYPSTSSGEAEVLHIGAGFPLPYPTLYLAVPEWAHSIYEAEKNLQAPLSVACASQVGTLYLGQSLKSFVGPHTKLQITSFQNHLS